LSRTSLHYLFVARRRRLALPGRLEVGMKLGAGRATGVHAARE
jgi:hypothetical protein